MGRQQSTMCTAQEIWTSTLQSEGVRRCRGNIIGKCLLAGIICFLLFSVINPFLVSILVQLLFSVSYYYLDTILRLATILYQLPLYISYCSLLATIVCQHSLLVSFFYLLIFSVNCYSLLATFTCYLQLPISYYYPPATVCCLPLSLLAITL